MIIRNTVGMFISPDGEILFNNGSHIEAVISNPEQFGLTLDEITAEYSNYGEPIGMGGKARSVLLKKVIRNGWIRLRRYRNQQWSVTVDKLDKRTLKHLENWSLAILGGTLGVKEADPYMPVVITELLSEQDAGNEVTCPINNICFER